MDIYFLEAYGKLYENIEDARLEVYEYKNQYGKVTHQFLKREIDVKIDGQTYYDLITPYGYGGPFVEVEQDGESIRQDLINDFTEDFENYCVENNIVSEFVRFHPMYQNQTGFENFYKVENIRKTILTEFVEKDNFQQFFSKSARKTTRRALREGVEYEVIENPTMAHLDGFLKVYYDTMDRNDASDYYYFPREYFEKMYHDLSKYLIQINVNYENNIIASAIYFIYEDNMHSHLSGTLNKYLDLSPAYVIKYAAFEYAEQKGLKYLHHGGGTSNNEKDPLLQFKKRFGTDVLDFYIGKKVYLKEEYKKLVIDKNIDKQNKNFFPLYRMESDDER